MTARRGRLRYLEKLRLAHAVFVVVMTLALLPWAIRLWQAGQATAGDVVLVCTLALAVLSASRHLAVPLVLVRQQFAPLSVARPPHPLPPMLRHPPAATPF